MAADGGGLQYAGWSELPDDLLITVYHRCCSSLYDRARFAAVCTAWRAIASQHPPLPGLPLLLPSIRDDGKLDHQLRAYSLEDGRALRLPVPWFLSGRRLFGSHDGGWVAGEGHKSEIIIVNLFSDARVDLSTEQSTIKCRCSAFGSRPTNRGTTVKKIIFSEDPSSSGCILAAMTTRCEVALCRVGCPEGGWTTRGCDLDTRYNALIDIAFCNCELYGFTGLEVFKFDIGVNNNGAPVVTSVHRLDVQMTPLHTVGVQSSSQYIFELHGKLAIAVLTWPGYYHCCESQFFRVFELMENDITSSYRYMWAEVTDLGDHALFLGPAGCRVSHVSTIGMCGMVEKNHIYYSEERYKDEVKGMARLDLGCCMVYTGESPGVHRLEKIMSRGCFYPDEYDSNCCVWLLPPDM
jgi:hypothetical protein